MNRTLLFLLIMFSLSKTVFSQDLIINKITPTVDNSSVQKQLENDYTNFLILNQDINSIKDYIKRIENTYNKQDFSGQLIIPNINGKQIKFNFKNSQILSENYLNDIQGIKTFKGRSEDGNYTIRFVLSHLGIMAKIRNTQTGEINYIQPIKPNQPELIIYNSNDPKLYKTLSSCQTAELNQDLEGNEPKSIVMAALGSCQIRTYRVAVATTGEYTAWAGGRPNALAYLTNSMNNVSEIYERDLTVRFSLITNDSLIHINANTDPYDANLTTNTLNQNTTRLNAKIGSANYDLGQIFGYGWGGGLAYISSVCNNTLKGGSGSGLNNGFSSGSSGPIFDNTVAHEIGHQFGALHTMSANTGGCNGNVSGSSAWETGGGSSIMAYAGTCVGLFYQYNSEPFFHGGNITQMVDFISSTPSCGVVTNSNNSNPVISNLINTFNIPHSTPFYLKVNATDSNSDSLTYSFDQMNPYGGSGTTSYPSSTDTFGPAFRFRNPSTSDTRYFPSLFNIINNVQSTYEVLPTVARRLNFLAIVRDNRDETGCVAQNSFVVNTKNCGPFQFTNLNTATSLVANGTNNVSLTWNTAITCVPTANVRIKFSIDGGKTFPYVILESTPNDGSQSIVVPNLSTCDGRFIIEAIDNIYFSVNSAVITITSICNANGTSIQPNNSLVATEGNSSLNLNLNPQYGTLITTPISGTISSSDPDVNLSSLDITTLQCNIYSNQTKYKTLTFYPSMSGNYTFTRITNNSNIVVSLYKDNYNPNSPCENKLASTFYNNNNATQYVTNFTQNLCQNSKYVMVVQSFDVNSPTLPFNYDINVVGPTGASLYSDKTNPGVGYNYAYVIVNNITNLIKSIVSSPNMSNSAIYGPNEYKVYGLSTTSNINTLNTTYANTPFQIFNTNVLNQTSNICGQLSQNSKLVTVSSILDNNLLNFNAKVSSQNSALVNWEVSEDINLSYYNLQRSLDAINFSNIAKINRATNSNDLTKKYTYDDQYFNHLASEKIYYRLEMVNKDSSVNISKIASLYKKAKINEINIFPNPVTDNQLNLSINSNENTTYKVEIINTLGQVINKINIEKQDDQILYPINIQNLNSGVYYLKIMNNGFSQTLKFSKK